MALQYTFQSLSIPDAVIIIKYYIYIKITSIQHSIWQFDKDLRLDLYELDDVCTNTANNISSLYSNYINEELNTSAFDFFTRLLS